MNRQPRKEFNDLLRCLAKKESLSANIPITNENMEDYPDGWLIGGENYPNGFGTIFNDELLELVELGFRVELITESTQKDVSLPFYRIQHED